MAHFVLGAVLEGSWRSLRDQHSSKLATQIEGKSRKNETKIDQKIDALPAHWHQDRIKNQWQLRKEDFQKY